MLNIKRAEIKTMDRDIVNLQGGKSGKGGGASEMLVERPAIDNDLEKKLLEAFSSFERKAEFAVPETQPMNAAAVTPQPFPAPAPTPTPTMPPIPPAPAPAIPEEPIRQEPVEQPRPVAQQPPAPPEPPIFEQFTAPVSTPPAMEEKIPEETLSVEEKIKQELIERKKKEEQDRIESETKRQEEKEKEEHEQRKIKQLKREERAEEEKERVERKKDLVLPVLLAEAKEKIRLDRIEVEKHLLDLVAQDKPLEDKKLELQALIEQMKTGELGLIIEREKEIETKKENLENAQQRNLTLAQEKLVSEKLWELEDKRKQIEKRRWQIEDQITKSEVGVKKVDLELAEKSKERKEIEDLVIKLKAKEKLIDFVSEKTKREEEITLIKEEKEKLEPDLGTIIGEKTQIEETLRELTESEKAIGEELKLVEEKEKQALTPDEKREIEKTRWKVESEMRKTTKEKWDYEQNKEKLDEAEKTIQERIAAVDQRLKNLLDKISSEEIVLEKEGINVRQLRAEVEKIWQENDFEYNPDVLNEISETDDNYLKDSWNQKETKAEPETEPVKMAARPETAKEHAEEPDAMEWKKAEAPVAKTTTQETTQRQTDSGARIGRGPIESTPNAPSAPWREPVDEKPRETLAPITENAKKTFDSPLVNKQTNGESMAPNRWPSEREGEKPLERESFGGDSLDGFKEKIDTPALSNTFGDRWGQHLDQTTGPTAPLERMVPEKKLDQGIGGEPLMDDMPAKSSGGKKLLVRILIIVICLAIFGVIAAFIFIKKPASDASDKTNTPAEENNDGNKDGNGTNSSNNNNNNTETPGDDSDDDSNSTGTAEPESLIATVSTLPIKIDDPANIPNVLPPYIQTQYQGEGYYRLLIENKKTKSYVGLAGFLSAFNIKAPSGFADRLDDNFTLFLYVSGGDNRLGFVTKITNPDGFADVMKNWEKTMEKDTQDLFKFLGKTEAASPSFFKTSTIPNSKLTFRYLSFPLPPSNKNSGLCYAINDDYFIFSSSGEGLQKIINQLK